MGKVDTDTDTPEHQFEDINLDDFPDNKSKSSSNNSPPSTSSSLGRKKYSFHHHKIEPLKNNEGGVYKAKEFDAQDQEFRRENSNR